MTIAVVTVANVTDPVELQDWFNEHSSATVTRVLNNSGVFYIFYE